MLLMLSASASAQYFSVLREDASRFPLVQGRFYAFDSALNLETLNRSDLEVKEFNDSKNLLSLTNAAVGQPQPVSYVIAIESSRGLDQSRLKMIRQAFQKWLTSFSRDQSECAIITYTKSNRLLSDFTTDTSALSSAFLKAGSYSSIDYNDALITDTAGALLVSKRARYRPVVIVIQYYTSDSTPQVSTIIEQANAQNCPIYNLRYQIRRSKEHLAISDGTGGLVFDELLTVDDYVTAFCTIQALSQEVRPGTAEWRSTIGCVSNHIRTDYEWNGIQRSRSYVTPLDKSVAVVCTPDVVDFGRRITPGAYDTTITVTARVLDATITSIASQSGNNVFSVVNASLPITIPANTSISLTIRYTPQDSTTQREFFDIMTESCTAQFLCLAGANNRGARGLAIVAPNGSEELVVGSDTTVGWRGISAEDTVKLELSTNGGNTWVKLEQQATGLQYQWSRVPLPTSDSCLIRATHTIGDQADSASDPVRRFGGHTSDVYAMAWSPNGQYMASIEFDYSLIIWDMRTGLPKTVHYLWGPRDLAWSPDGSEILVCSGYGDIAILDVATDSFVVHREFIPSGGFTDVTWSNDGTQFILGQYTLFNVLYDRRSMTPVDTILSLADSLSCVEWSPDGRWIALVNRDRSVLIYDGSDPGQPFPVARFVDHSYDITALKWSPDSKFLASGDVQGKVSIWAVNGWLKERSFWVETDTVTSISWSFDGRFLATGVIDGIVQVWDAATGNQTDRFDCGLQTSRVAWSTTDLSLSMSGESTLIRTWDMSSRRLLSQFKGHKGEAGELSWESNDSLLFTIGRWGQSINIYDASTNTLLSYILLWEGIRDAAWNPIDKRIAVISDDDAISIWNSIDGSLIDSLMRRTDDVDNTSNPMISWDVDGKGVISTGVDSLIILQDPGTWKVHRTIYSLRGDVRRFDRAPDGGLLVAGHEDGSIVIWNYRTGESVRELSPPSEDTYLIDVEWSPDGTMIASILKYTEGQDRSELIIWDANTGRIVSRPDNPGLADTLVTANLAWHPDCKQIVFSGMAEYKKGLKAIVWDVELNRVVWTSDTTHGYRDVTWNHSGTMLSATEGSQVHTWSWANNLESDTSDGLFSIVAPEMRSRPIDMGPCFVFLTKDSVVTGLVENTSAYQVYVDSIYFAGPDANSFGLSSPFVPFVTPANDSTDVGLRFRPTRVGPHTAQIVIVARHNTLYQTIIGEGIFNDSAHYVVALNHTTAVVGDLFMIEMTLTERSDTVAESQPREFEARIGINPHIVHLMNNSDDCLSTSPNRCVIDVRGTVGNTNVLYSTQAKATLGNTDQDVLTLESFRWIDAKQPHSVATENGSIHITDVCEEGGTRLYISNRAKYSLSCRPNPASTNVNIDYSLAGSATVTIEILSFTGDVVLVPIQDVAVQSGLHSLTVDTSLFGDGVYIVQLRTRVATLTSLMTVQK